MRTLLFMDKKIFPEECLNSNQRTKILGNVQIRSLVSSVRTHYPLFLSQEMEELDFNESLFLKPGQNHTKNA